MIKVGILGLGKMGLNHLNELSKNENFKINALYDIRKIDISFPFFENLDDFLNQDLDLLIIATPTSTHLDIAKKTFSKFKNILIEKPLALNLNQMEHIKTLSKEFKVNVAIGFCERFNPVVLALKKYLKNEKIISINIKRFSLYPDRIFDVGILSDLSCHDLDLLSYLSDKNITKYKILKSFNKDKLREDEALISADLDEILAFTHQSWNCSKKIRIINVICEDNFYEANLNDFSLIKNDEIIQILKTTPLFNEHQELIKMINNEKNLLANIDDAIKVQKILEGV